MFIQVLSVVLVFYSSHSSLDINSLKSGSMERTIDELGEKIETYVLRTTKG